MLFDFFKKRKKASNYDTDATIKKLRKVLTPLLIDPACLKKMGVKDPFADDAKVTKKLSVEDAVTCLHALKLAVSKVEAFHDALMPMADAVNEEIQTERMDAVRNRKRMPTENDFYTMSNILAIFKSSTAGVEVEKPQVENPKDLPVLFKASLLFFRSRANITLRFLIIKATSMGIIIQ